MGGNVNIDGIKAEPFVLKTSEDRNKLKTKVITFLASLDSITVARNDGRLNHFDCLVGNWSGSTKHLMDSKISDEEFIVYKSEVGDIDVRVKNSYKDIVLKALEPGKNLHFIVIGTKLHGHEVSVLVRDRYTLKHHQIDLEFVDDPSSKSEDFLHSSSWDDLKLGIKGVHHKLLLNAAGGETYKFSITHGLRPREIHQDSGIKTPEVIHYALFGTKCPVENVWSFTGIVNSILQMPVKKFSSREEMNKAIFDKFVDSCSKIKNVDHQPAIDYLKRIV